MHTHARTQIDIQCEMCVFIKLHESASLSRLRVFLFPSSSSSSSTQQQSEPVAPLTRGSAAGGGYIPLSSPRTLPACRGEGGGRGEEGREGGGCCCCARIISSEEEAAGRDGTGRAGQRAAPLHAASSPTQLVGVDRCSRFEAAAERRYFSSPQQSVTAWIISVLL